MARPPATGRAVALAVDRAGAALAGECPGDFDAFAGFEAFACFATTLPTIFATAFAARLAGAVLAGALFAVVLAAGFATGLARAAFTMDALAAGLAACLAAGVFFAAAFFAGAAAVTRLLAVEPALDTG